MDACEHHWSVIGSIIFSNYFKKPWWESFACPQTSSTSPQANVSLKIMANCGEIPFLHSFSALAFSPSGLDALCTTAWWSDSVTSPMKENRLTPLECRPESALRLKAAWNCPFQMLYLLFVSNLRNGSERVSLDVAALDVVALPGVLACNSSLYHHNWNLPQPEHEYF